MTEIDYDKMWEELLAETWAETHILPGEKSIKMISDELGTTPERARSMMEKHIRNKTMRKRYVQQGKAKFIVYSFIIAEK